jgi:hypothetical protein
LPELELRTVGRRRSVQQGRILVERLSAIALKPSADPTAALPIIQAKLRSLATLVPLYVGAVLSATDELRVS